MRREAGEAVKKFSKTAGVAVDFPETEGMRPLEGAVRSPWRTLAWSLSSYALNSVFATLTFAGSVFVLYLAELGLPSGQVGLALSLFPFAGLLALGFAPAAARWGRKRVFLACYGARKLVMALLLLLPWVLAEWGRSVGLVFLCVVIGTFAVLRALAETAYYPWMQEFVPDRIRGRFSAWMALMYMLLSIVVLWVAGYVLAAGSGLWRFSLLIGAGCVIGIVSVALHARVSGGAPIPPAGDDRAHLADMAAALRDLNFVRYLRGMGAVTVGTAALTCFLPIYLTQRVGFPAATVVRLEAVFMAGGALSVLVWGWAADRFGSRPVLMLSMGMSLLVPAGWLLLPGGMGPGLVVCGALFFLQGVASNGMGVGAGRLLFNGVVPLERNTPYMALYYATMGLAGGVAPLLAGGLLTVLRGWDVRLGWIIMDGYSVLFALAAVLLVFGWRCYGQVRPDDVHTTRDLLARVAMVVWGGRR